MCPATWSGWNMLTPLLPRQRHVCTFSKQLRRVDVPTTDFYTTVVRLDFECACSVWHSGLTVAQSDLFESVQKRAIYIIYPTSFYLTSLIVTGIDSWHTARKEESVLMVKFFKRHILTSSSLLHSMLPDRRDNDTTSSLRNAKPFYSLRTRRNRFRKSFLPYCLDNYT